MKNRTTQQINTLYVLVLVALLGILPFSKAAAQSDTVVGGKVISSDDKMPLPGVNVMVKGTNNGTITNFDGEYKLTTTQKNVTLVFSFIGYLSKEVSVNGASNIDVTLEPDVEQLEEVVVVGYGVQKKSVVTGAISSVKADEIAKTPVPSVEQALQGRTAGVMVSNDTGQPGAGITVRIRGVGTNGVASPLYIVDGVQVENLSFLNPGDIASMEVLKDAASSAIYGSRGANGVVLVTTKKGKSGKLVLNYDGYVGVQNPSRKVSVLNAREYMTLHNEARYNDGQSPLFTEEQIANNTVDTDWQDEIFNKNAVMTNHQLQLSGGNDISTFSVSTGYFAQDGIVGGGDKSNYNRFTFRINSEHKFTDRITLGQNLSFTKTNSQGIEEQNEFGSILYAATIHDPITPVYVTDQAEIDRLDQISPNPVKDPSGRFYGISQQGLREIVNPMAALQNTFNENMSRQLVGNFYGSIKLMDGLTFRSDYGYNIGNSSYRGFTPVAYFNVVNRVNNNSTWTGSSQYYNWQLENVLTYERTLGDHNFTLMAGTTHINEYREWINGSRTNLNLSGWDYAWLDNGANDETQKSNGAVGESRLMSYFGRLNYNYREKYLLTATIRMDGSSRFGPDNQFGYFPSVSAGWVLSEEDFLKQSELISFMKLRASWGQIGNEKIGNFAYLSLAGATISYPLGVSGSPVTGFGILNAANPALKWEASEQTNIGLEIGLLQDKLTMTAEYYNKVTKGLLSEEPIPSYVGLNNPTSNLGTVANSGVELNVTYRTIERDFNYSISGNVAYNQNEITELNNQNGYINSGAYYGHSGNSRMEIGYPLPFFYGYKTNGIFQSQEEVASYVGPEGQVIQPDAKAGDIRFVDTNNDGKIDDNDRTNIGSAVPTWTYGLTLGADYKNFDLSVFFQGQAGNKIANLSRRQDLTYQNYNARALDRWTGEGNDFPRMTHADPNKNYTRLNDMVHLEDGSFVRVKNIQLGYTLPNTIAEKAGLSRARLYMSVQNLYTWTKYSGFDPEIGGGGLEYGVDKGAYPQSQVILFGTNLTF
ncbi:TonB-dependent receptor [Limibacter armeniacum]|uniref:SusC/RagA family TonB-linked outer membrane protein n=1 Tax=Limibacter armeniacum TaxID=466084 RepID=UPI002FE51A1D